MSNNKKVYRWLVELSLIFIIIFSMRLWMQRGIVEGTAPNISQIMLNGQHFDLYQAKNKPILVHFWATWCSVCKLEQSNIENIAEDLPVITIAMQSGDNKKLLQFMKDENLSFNVINDDNGELSRLYKIKGVPVSFIINKNNNIKFIEVGYTTEFGLRMRIWWAGL